MLRSLIYNFSIRQTKKCLKLKQIYTPYLNHINIRLLHINQITTIENLMQKQLTEPTPNWESFRNDVLAVDTRRISHENLDFLILSQCTAQERHKFALNYVKYLENNGNFLNLAALSKLLKIYGLMQRQKNKTNVDIEEDILKIYKQLVEKHKLLDCTLTESVIFALSTTKEWKECLKLKQNLDNYDIPTGLIFDSLISTLFAHGEEEEAWKLMQETIDKDRSLGASSIQACLTFINSFEDYPKFLSKIERLFDFWSINDILITENVAIELVEMFTKQHKKAQLTTIGVKGNCSKCKTCLPETKFTQEDFNQLKDAFFTKVIVGKDVFRKTTPPELDEFRRFINNKQHYDVIVDGLNVAYSKGVKQSEGVQSMMVASVVEHYARQNKTVLVLGRNHMKRWPQLRRIRQNAQLFLTQNLSQDDPYLLYCALNSGPGTVIVSRDMMRGHLYLLKDAQLKLLFKRWLSVTRYQLLSVGKDGKLAINIPPCYIISAQKHENVWHLPIMEKTTPNERKNSFQLKSQPNLWLCVQI